MIGAVILGCTSAGVAEKPGLRQGAEKKTVRGTDGGGGGSGYSLMPGYLFRAVVPRRGAAVFWIYLRRELRRRMRQAVFVALGLALGIGLVITVTSAAAGVQNAQASVLHSLYGVGTDLTVTQPPKQGSGTSLTFGFQQQIKQVRSGQLAAGAKINDNELQNTQYGTLTAAQLAAVSGSSTSPPPPARWH